jgi:type IV pilus assembly protein PilA
MYSSLIERLEDGRGADRDAGFTLVELIVVLLILAILLAIAIPTFLGVPRGAKDKAAQANLNTALVTAKGAVTENGQSYNTTGGGTTNIDVATLNANEPSIKFVAGPVTGTEQVSAYFSLDGNGVVLATYSKNNTCWYALDNLNIVGDTTGPYAVVPTAAGTQYGHKSSTTGPTACDATGAAALAGITWGTHF